MSLSHSPLFNTLTLQISIVANIQFLYCVSFVLSAAIINELISADGIIDIIEGVPFTNILTTSGFSYGNIPIRISILTYSEYAASGNDLEDDFDPSEIPMDAADGMNVDFNVE